MNSFVTMIGHKLQLLYTWSTMCVLHVRLHKALGRYYSHLSWMWARTRAALELGGMELEKGDNDTFANVVHPICPAEYFQ